VRPRLSLPPSQAQQHNLRLSQHPLPHPQWMHPQQPAQHQPLMHLRLTAKQQQTNPP
jgi:hypothetical protein